MDEVLAAVDGSEQSYKVVDTACDFAKSKSAGVLLVYVMKVPSEEPEGVIAFETAEHYPDAYTDYLQQVGAEVTSKLRERIEKTGVKCRVVTPTGNPANEILSIAEIEKSKAIVLGLKGLHGIGRVRSLGSVARRVIENSKTPVLVVPSD